VGSYYVRQGHSYMGGASRPFFITNGMLVQAAIDRGFDQAKVIARDEFPASQLPPLPADTDDDWNVLGSGRRATSDGAVDLPGAVKWVVDVTQTAQPTSPEPQQVDPGTGQPTAPSTSGDVTWLPPVYPEMIPQDLPWTTTPSSVWDEVFFAAAIGTVGFLIYEALRG
jgi:hypothetical protein